MTNTENARFATNVLMVSTLSKKRNFISCLTLILYSFWVINIVRKIDKMHTRKNLSLPNNFNYTNLEVSCTLNS